MKIRKLLCFLCAFSMILALTACNSDSTPKDNESNTGEADASAFTFQLNGTDCSVYGSNDKLSEYPEPYCSLKKGEKLKAGIQTTVSSGLNKQPFYKVWLRNDQETDCAYADALVRQFFLMGGEPGDMVYCGITFGQTEEETDALAEKAKKAKSYNEYNGISELDTLLRNLLFNELGEDWIDQIKWVDYKSKAEDKRYYELNVIFVEGKVYAMCLNAYYL